LSTEAWLASVSSKCSTKSWQEIYCVSSNPRTLPDTIKIFVNIYIFRASSVFNTEIAKDTRFTDAKSVRGNQQLLMDLIENGKIDMKKLNSMKKNQLNDALVSIGFDKGEVKRLIILLNMLNH
jgi:hypothetical protein